MAVVELTLPQILDAVRQLPEKERQLLMSEIQRMPKRAQARAAVERLRGQFTLPSKKQRRMSELLAKSSNESLAAGESDELDALVDEFQTQAMRLAQEVARSEGTGANGRSPSRGRKR